MLRRVRLLYLLDRVYASADVAEVAQQERWENLLSGGEKQRLAMVFLSLIILTVCVPPPFLLVYLGLCAYVIARSFAHVLALACALAFSLISIAIRRLAFSTTGPTL